MQQKPGLVALIPQRGRLQPRTVWCCRDQVLITSKSESKTRLLLQSMECPRGNGCSESRKRHLPYLWLLLRQSSWPNFFLERSAKAECFELTDVVVRTQNEYFRYSFSSITAARIWTLISNSSYPSNRLSQQLEANVLWTIQLRA